MLGYFHGEDDIANGIVNSMERFEVRRPDKSVIQTCYNLNKVAKVGICETFEDKPYNWGFCSRSCRFAHDSERHDAYDDPYEETEMIIENKAPRGSIPSTGNAAFC